MKVKRCIVIKPGMYRPGVPLYPERGLNIAGNDPAEFFQRALEAVVDQSVAVFVQDAVIGCAGTVCLEAAAHQQQAVALAQIVFPPVFPFDRVLPLQAKA